MHAVPLKNVTAAEAPAERAAMAPHPIAFDGDLDEVHAVLWRSIRHLFPAKALAVEPKPGWLSITWSMDGDPKATFSFATPILIRMENELLDAMWTCDSRDSQHTIAQRQEASVLAGMRGYDPYASLPNARVIVLG